jgi:hypothetical protein
MDASPTKGKKPIKRDAHASPAAGKSDKKKRRVKPDGEVNFMHTKLDPKTGLAVNFFTDAKNPESRRHALWQEMKAKAQGLAPGTAQAASKDFVKQLEALQVKTSDSTLRGNWPSMRLPSFNWDTGVGVKPEPKKRKFTRVKPEPKAEPGAPGKKTPVQQTQSTPAAKSAAALPTPLKEESPPSTVVQAAPKVTSTVLTIAPNVAQAAAEVTSTALTIAPNVAQAAPEVTSRALTFSSRQPKMIKARLPIALGQVEMLVTLDDGSSVVADSLRMQRTSRVADAAVLNGSNTIHLADCQPAHALALLMYVHNMSAVCIGLLPGAFLVGYQFGFDISIVGSLGTEVLHHAHELAVARLLRCPELRPLFRKALAYSNCSSNMEMESWWREQV